jgi:hypothetical protein
MLLVYVESNVFNPTSWWFDLTHSRDFIKNCYSKGVWSCASPTSKAAVELNGGI